MNVRSFQDVMQHTVVDRANNLLIMPEEMTPTNSRITATFAGAKPTARELDNWVITVRTAIERQAEQANEAARSIPSDAGSGERGPSVQGRGPRTAGTEQGVPQLEAELVSKLDDAEGNLRRIESQLADLSVKARELDEYVVTLKAMLDMVRGRDEPAP